MAIATPHQHKAAFYPTTNIKMVKQTHDRTSFSSIKESDDGIAQSFTTSKTSSYLRAEDEEVISDGLITPPTMTNPQSALHGVVCPCNGFRGWKAISLRGKVASKSSGDLKALRNNFDWDVKRDVRAPVAARREDGRCEAGKSPLETLPMELLGSIIDQLATDIPPNGFTPRNIDLMSLLLTSHGLHAATLATLYKHITIPHSRIFAKFLSHVSAHPALGTIVRRLDFSHFNPTGAGQTRRERENTQNLIPKTLLECLSLTPNLREFLVQEHIDDELSAAIIKTLLCDLPQLKALDFCACSSTSFRDAFTSVLETSTLPPILPITRLSLHECTILPSSVFTDLLPHLPRLTHLDAAHTRITDTSLFSIPPTAQLTHLNLSKCSHLSGAAVVAFLSSHPAAKTLVYLNLAMDAKSHDLLSATELSSLLPALPSTLKCLSLKGSKMDSSHIPLLLPLTKHLEELGLGRNLKLSDIQKLFVPDKEEADWVRSELRYVDVSDLSATQLDLGTLFGSSCPILQRAARPLEVLELSDEVHKKVSVSHAALKRVGWCVKEAGRRSWLVRVKGSATASAPTSWGSAKEKEEEKDGGTREWKWGAAYWGMRKFPVARAEVGGMYGHYMFKR
ncbi:F-box protein [Lachnellula hyalina]|uniref:F-box protein n=1 Tax=Lachnellula hyalina TaxID=1316788 RepID=A0A8H8R2I4_9HELO|nr:F-box protein [Lachnellula hyalina]TVY27173.1 F-box protein [Lachnellula hyalina]